MQSAEINTSISEEAKIVLSTREFVWVIGMNEIIRCEAKGSYTVFFLKNEEITVSKTIKEYDYILTQQGFIRTHQSHLVNISMIKKYNRQKGSSLLLINGDLVPVAQRKREAVLTLIQKIMLPTLT